MLSPFARAVTVDTDGLRALVLDCADVIRRQSRALGEHHESESERFPAMVDFGLKLHCRGRVHSVAAYLIVGPAASNRFGAQLISVGVFMVALLTDGLGWCCAVVGRPLADVRGRREVALRRLCRRRRSGA